MSVTTILFDLDGTLLPMDLNEFLKAYMQRLSQWVAPYGYDSETLQKTVWQCTGAMYANDGSRTNEAAFWEQMQKAYSPKVMEHYPVYDSFYDEEFDRLQSVCGFQKGVAPMIRQLQEKGYRLILATNPLFPQKATYRRICWTGLEPSDFSLITTCENSSFSKPNPEYYRQVLDQAGVTARECIMIGNDVQEDMVAGQLGMELFLLTDCLINRDGTDISQYPHGDFTALQERLNRLPWLTDKENKLC